jgi:hypothetical protein
LERVSCQMILPWRSAARYSFFESVGVTWDPPRDEDVLRVPNDGFKMFGMAVILSDCWFGTNA